MKYEWIGFLATFLTALSLLPTVYTAIFKKSTNSISYGYILLGFLSQFFWLIYGIYNKNYPISTLAIYLMTVYIIIIIAKWHYERTGQNLLAQAKKNKYHVS
jgi:uncharacterized protein with PQ loop repeat